MTAPGPTGAPARLPRLAVVISHPIQYYSPWFRWLRERTQIEFRVFYLWDFGVARRVDPGFGKAIAWDVDLLSGYDHEFVPNRARHPDTIRFGGLWNPGLRARLADWRPEAILLFGYRYATHLALIAWASARRIPLVFRGDSHLLGRGRPGPAARAALGLLYARFAAVTYVGQANRGYFRALGVPDSRLHFAPHAVDDALFNPGNPSHREAAQALRARLGLADGTRVVLYSGKLTPAKQPRELLEAFLAERPPGTALVIAGDGPEEADLRACARAAPDGAVHFLPFANQSEMPARYLMADLFVLPSRGVYETWGLAVNEAMHLGVPALVSDRVGCQQDLVTEGVTGWVVNAADPGGLRAALARALAALADPDARARIRRAAAERIAGYTYARAAQGLQEALASLPRRRGR